MHLRVPQGENGEDEAKRYIRDEDPCDVDGENNALTRNRFARSFTIAVTDLLPKVLYRLAEEQDPEPG
jgi:hypothetical protein